MKKTGILCASDTELEPFLKYIQSPRIIEKAMLKFYSGHIGQAAVVAVYSGVCKVNAAIAAQLLIDVFDVGSIINAGTAGGMDERVQLFDTVISERMAYHDMAEDILTEFHPPPKGIAGSPHFLFGLGQWFRANSLLKMKREAKLTENLRRFPLTWKRSA